MLGKTLKVIRFIATWGGLVIILLVCVGLVYRAYRQHANANAIAIHTPNGIDEAMFVSIGGIDQWITIRGQDRNNPVVLFLHGGPGTPTNLLDFSIATFWTSTFTLVQWDQRGAGKTFGKGGTSASSMTIDRMARDGVELTEFLRGHLHKDKIVIVGHSWGTILGVHMVKMRPDLFCAYVGTGQVVDSRENEATNYARVLAKERALGDARAIAALQVSGPPPYRTMKALTTQRIWAQALEHADSYVGAEQASSLCAPGYSLYDLFHVIQSIQLTLNTFIGASMTGPLMSENLELLGPEFAVPVFVFEGPDDYITSPVLAKAYVSSINSPKKEFVMLDAGGHFAVFTNPGEFVAEMNSRVRPLALR